MSGNQGPNEVFNYNCRHQPETLRELLWSIAAIQKVSLLMFSESVLILWLFPYFMFLFQVCKVEPCAIQVNIFKQEENDPKNQDWVHYHRLCTTGVSDQLTCNGSLTLILFCLIVWINSICSFNDSPLSHGPSQSRMGTGTWLENETKWLPTAPRASEGTLPSGIEVFTQITPYTSMKKILKYYRTWLEWLKIYSRHHENQEVKKRRHQINQWRFLSVEWNSLA